MPADDSGMNKLSRLLCDMHFERNFTLACGAGLLYLDGSVTERARGDCGLPCPLRSMRLLLDLKGSGLGTLGCVANIAAWL